MKQLRMPIAAITDEFSSDLATALEPMAAMGMTGAELRVVFGKNIMDLTNDELKLAKELCDQKGMKVIGIASPILKCVLPGAPPVDPRFQQDTFNSKHTFDDQARLADRAFEIAGLLGCNLIRVFSYWRSIEPDACFDAIVKALAGLADQAKSRGIIIGLENEHACNIGTAVEARKLMDALDHPNLQLVWDPANALVGGEKAYPDGYELLPVKRIAHVHAKDCHMEGHTPIWGPVGTRNVNWQGQIAALLRDGYPGYLSLETHWAGPPKADGSGNDKFLASTICGWNLRGLVAAS